MFLAGPYFFEGPYTTRPPAPRHPPPSAPPGTTWTGTTGTEAGPWGMAQTGVPFGEVMAVRDWLAIEGRAGKPEPAHPERPVLGLACPRSEVSGARLWGWAKHTFGTPRRFFERFFVANYCPLLFLEASGRNRTPDKLRVHERQALFAACDRALRETVAVLGPTHVVGVGGFATRRAEEVLGTMDIIIGSIPHPSPANPSANRGWEALARQALSELGIEGVAPG
ncbi:MAG: uracil-DNA glycosylase family protein [Planctomycetota bacterium]